MLKKALRMTLPLFSVATVMAQNSGRPNIILFLADDLGWQDTSLPFWSERTPQNDRYRTPNMERLANAGMMFTNAYACPVSTPTRCSLISGMNAARHGVTNWIEQYNQNTNAGGGSITLPDWNWNGVQPANLATAADRVRSTLITPLPQLLREAGYLTIHCGKGNFGAAGTLGASPSSLGFDVNIAGAHFGGPGTYLAQDNYGSAIQTIGGLEEYAAQGLFLTEALTLEAIKNLDAAVETGKPFFLYMSHYAIHTPYDADPRFAGNYTNYHDRLFDGALNTSEINRAALIEGLDKSLGDLMDWVAQREDILNNTVILFMSDNGGQGVAPRQGRLNRDPNYPSRGGKGSGYDGGVHEPMIVSWPEVVEEGVRNENRVMIEDFFPSILEMAGILKGNTVQTVDGKSFVDLLKDPTLTRDRVNIWHYPNRWGESADKREGYGTWSAMMKGDHHLIYFWENQELRLYNLREDIGEQHNLAQTLPELTRAMAQELTDSLKAYGARRPTLPVTGEYVPWPADGVYQASAGDAMNVNELGVTLSTAEGEKHLYTVQDARDASGQGAPFFWTQGTHHGYPAVQATMEKLEGSQAAKQQFYFTQGSDDFHLHIYTADGQPVSFTEGLTRSSWSGTELLTTPYLQYGAVTEPTDFQIIKTGTAGYFGIMVNGQYLNDRGTSNGEAANMNWVVMPYSGSHYTDNGSRYRFASIHAQPEDPNTGLPKLTTNEQHPVYYRIRNTRFAATGKASYARFLAADQKLSLTANAEEATQFYFVGTSTDGVMTVRIRCNATTDHMAGEAAWNAEGTDWYVKRHTSNQGGIDASTGSVYTGVLISREADFAKAWYVGSSDTSIKLYSSQWDGSIFTMEEVGAETGGEQTLEEQITQARIALRLRLNQAKRYTEYIIPGVLNAYSLAAGSEDYAALMGEVEGYLDQLPSSSPAVLQQLTAYSQRVQEAMQRLAINQPEAGSFLRIRSAKTLGYARRFDPASSGNDPECLSLSAKADDDGIFYFDGTYLVNFKNGLFMDTNWLHAPGGVKSKMNFIPSGDGMLGAYYVVAVEGSKGTRYLMVHNSQHHVMHRSDANNAYNNFWLEQVKALPLTVQENGWGSLYLPQAVRLPGELRAYTAQVGEGSLLLTEVGREIPAATPVLVAGIPGAYTLSVLASSPAASATNELAGTYSTEYTTGRELTWDGEKMIREENDVIWGFTAYMDLDSGAEGLLSSIEVGIPAVRTTAPQSQFYDLSGRLVVSPRKGVYIQQGRKTIIL